MIPFLSLRGEKSTKRSIKVVVVKRDLFQIVIIVIDDQNNRWRRQDGGRPPRPGLLTNVKNKFDTTANETDEMPNSLEGLFAEWTHSSEVGTREGHLARIRITENGFGRTHAR